MEYSHAHPGPQTGVDSGWQKALPKLRVELSQGRPLGQSAFGSPLKNRYIYSTCPGWKDLTEERAEAEAQGGLWFCGGPGRRGERPSTQRLVGL